MQDLVEALSKEKSWYTPRKANQQAYERKPDGSFKGFEEEVCPLRHSQQFVFVSGSARQSQMQLPVLLAKETNRPGKILLLHCSKGLLLTLAPQQRSALLQSTIHSWACSIYLSCSYGSIGMLCLLSPCLCLMLQQSLRTVALTRELQQHMHHDCRCHSHTTTATCRCTLRWASTRTSSSLLCRKRPSCESPTLAAVYTHILTIAARRPLPHLKDRPPFRNWNAD